MTQGFSGGDDIDRFTEAGVDVLRRNVYGLPSVADAEEFLCSLDRAGRQNALCENFNGRFRDECLNEHGVLSLADARRIIASWREDYNHHRPHRALGSLTPAAVRDRLTPAAASRSQPLGCSS
ncbi:MAG: transposase [Chloroflexia bacterium]|nr:transposase [Chloroflexia bacterium]